jgi:hypothetical protein
VGGVDAGCQPRARKSDKTVVVKIMETVQPVPPEATGGTPKPSRSTWSLGDGVQERDATAHEISEETPGVAWAKIDSRHDPDPGQDTAQ